MFKMIRPCKTCPFRKGVGKTFRLRRDRLDEIFNAVAFQCHGTVDYDNWDDPEKRSGDKPQQCAGLMSLLYRAKRSNTIMQVGERWGHFDPARLDHSEVYGSIEDAIRDHCD
jgi:hypothetical protein